nr:oligosaccharide flippase family protein [uncultured Vibrio sp.]
MSLQKDTLVNYISRGYLGLIGIAISPLFFHFLGSESFGIISVFTVIQTWLQLLDLGLSNTLSRESAKYKSGCYKKNEFNNLLKYIRLFYFILSFCLFFLALHFSEEIANSEWFNTEQVSSNDIVIYVQIMAACISLRWLSIPFRSILVGFSQHTVLAKVDILMATYRSPICFLLLYVFEANLMTYFVIQLSHSIILIFLLYIASKDCLNKFVLNDRTPFKNKEKLSYKAIANFTAQMLFTTIVWLIVSQFDKLYLSKNLSLSEYGMLTIAIQLSSVIMLLSSPFSVALLPRLTSFKVSGEIEKYVDTYINAFHFSMSILVPVCCVVFFFSDEILLLWTKSLKISEYGGDIVRIYILGNLLMAIGAFAYYLLFTSGNLKPHVKMSIFSGVILLPTYVYAINNYAALGSATTWVIYNLLLVVFWVPYVQIKSINLRLSKMFYTSLLKIMFISIFIVSGAKFLFVGVEGIYLIFLLGFLLIFSLVLSLIANSRFLIYFKKVVSSSRASA